MSFASLPEGCIATIISLTSPKDACVASAVSLGFKSAAESDTVWDRYLPSDYKDIIARCSSSSELYRPGRFSRLKELYFKLCDTPILLGEGKRVYIDKFFEQSLRLIKPTGKKCYMLCARDLSLAWQDDPTIWKWTSLPESRFTEVAQLVDVPWVAIAGTLQASMLSPDTIYSAYLVFKLAEEHYGLNESSTSSICFVDDDGLTNNKTHGTRIQRRHILFPLTGQFRRTRTDSWNEIELGEIFIGRYERRHVRVRFRLFEPKRPSSKGGVIVEGIELRPRI